MKPVKPEWKDAPDWANTWRKTKTEHGYFLNKNPLSGPVSGGQMDKSKGIHIYQSNGSNRLRKGHR